MKRNLLLGSTALIAGGMVAADLAEAADPLRLEVRGFRNEAFGIGEVDHDTADYNNTGHFSDGEVQFRGSTTLDNGITVGVQVELEAFSTGDQIDENYAFVEGGFGKLVLGSENTAPYQQFWSVTAPAVGAPLNSGWITTFIPACSTCTTGFRTAALTTNLDITNDDNIVSYYSPRFAGFQLAVAYVPTAQINGDGKNSPTQANEATEYRNGFSGGLHFTQSFNGFDVTAAGAINWIEGPGQGSASGGGGSEDIRQYKGGLNFGFGGFTLGGSVGYEESDRPFEGIAFDGGVSYETGPWGVSATFFHSEVDGENDFLNTGEGDDSVLAIAGSVAYTLGPGINTYVTGLYGEWEDDDADDSDGFVGILGLRVNY